MISYLETIPFSKYFKSLIPIITFYYRQVVSKQQFSLKIISLTERWMFRRIQVFDRLRKCHLNCTDDQTVYVLSYYRFDFHFCSCKGRVNLVSTVFLTPPFDLYWTNQHCCSSICLPFPLHLKQWKRTFVLLVSHFAVESNNTCLRCFIMRWYDYWYTLEKEEISTNCCIGCKENTFL